jgi:hypothetical protein
VDGRPTCPTKKCTKNVEQIHAFTQVIKSLFSDIAFLLWTSYQYRCPLSRHLKVIYNLFESFIDFESYGTWVDSCKRSYLFSKEKVNNGMLKINEGITLPSIAYCSLLGKQHMKSVARSE